MCKNINAYINERNKVVGIPLTLDNLFKEDNNFTYKDIIFTIVGYICNNYPVIEDNNYMLILAAHIKSITRKEVLDDLLLKYSIPNSVSDSDNMIYKYCSATEKNDLRKKICVSPIETEDLDELNNLCIYENGDSICNDTDDFFKKNGYIFGNWGSTIMLYDFIKIIFNNIDNTDLYTYIDIGISKRVLIYMYDKEPKKRFELITTIDNTQYRVRSADISVISKEEEEGSHSVCGIITNENKYYIYDSHNQYIEEGWSVLLDGEKHILPNYNKQTKEYYICQIFYIVLL